MSEVNLGLLLWIFLLHILCGLFIHKITKLYQEKREMDAALWRMSDNIAARRINDE